MEVYEGKILEINKDLILERLNMLSATLIMDHDVKSVYFDFSDMRLRKQNKILRLRFLENNCFLMLKERKHNNQINVFEEDYIELDNQDNLASIFRKMDVLEFSRDLRHITSYRLNDTLVKISIYPNIPAFISIEANSEDELRESVILLGFSMQDVKPWSSKDILDFYLNKGN